MTVAGSFRGRLLGSAAVRRSLSLLIVIALAAILVPFFASHDLVRTDFDAQLMPPAPAASHWFGTDELGRDLFVRTFAGTRVTLVVAVIASIVSLVIGVAWGAIAGYAGGKVDSLMMRLVDALYALPFLFLVILLMVAFERNFLLIFVAIGAINWLDMARVVRGQTLSLKHREFVDAARLCGVTPAAIVLRHIAPNLLGVVVVYLTLTIPQAILVESFLSFLGLGVQEPQTSLGALVNGGVAHMERAPWLLLIPASLLAVILLAFNFLGDGLRDVLDPKVYRPVSLLEVTSLDIGYPAGPGRVVRELSFAIEAGRSLGLVGESGSGKTQTALAVMGLLPDEARVSGRIVFDGESLLGADDSTLNRVRARRVAMVFQDPAQALNPYVRVGDQLRFILAAHRVVPRRRFRQRALELMDRVGLPDGERQLASFPHQLSGGMRQRAMIAMALAAEPALLIADEPTTALDVTVQAQILDLLRGLRADTGIALMLITHDLGVIAGNCDSVLVMRDGRMLETAATADLFSAPAHAHTRTMLASAPRIDAPAAVPPLAGEAPPVVEVDGLSVSYREANAWPGARRRPLHAVRGVSFTLARGETLAIVGESGSGKTTVARALLGLVPHDGGAIRFLGEPLAGSASKRKPAVRRSLQMVFQDPVGSLNPAMRVGQTLAEVLKLHRPRLDRGARVSRVREMLGRVGLDGSMARRFPHELSGGQAQRVAIARALTPEPSVLVCDEAVAALDGTVRAGILALLEAEQRTSGLSIVFISHDLAVVRRISHRVLVMYLGRVSELAGNDALFARPRHPYTRALMDAVPVPDPDARRPLPVAGETASTLRPPPGCAFHPRCLFAVGVCREREPPVDAFGAGVVACHRAAELDLSGTIARDQPFAPD